MNERDPDRAVSHTVRAQLALRDLILSGRLRPRRDEFRNWVRWRPPAYRERRCAWRWSGSRRRACWKRFRRAASSVQASFGEGDSRRRAVELRGVLRGAGGTLRQPERGAAPARDLLNR